MVFSKKKKTNFRCDFQLVGDIKEPMSLFEKNLHDMAVGIRNNETKNTLKAAKMH